MLRQAAFLINLNAPLVPSPSQFFANFRADLGDALPTQKLRPANPVREKRGSATITRLIKSPLSSAVGCD